MSFDSSNLSDFTVLVVHLFRIIVHIVKIVVGRACDTFVIDEFVGLFEVIFTVNSMF